MLHQRARLPGWFPRDSTKGWVHAEYSLLPGSTDSRFRRERRGAKGRTQEIERLVARSLRAAVDLEELGPIALNVDCDILNADGGTRCASITAANLHSDSVYDASSLLVFACQRTCDQLRNNAAQDGALLFSQEEQMAHEMRVMEHDVAAISVGLIDGKSYLDLDYILDSNADVDMNVVKVSNGAFVEVQGTGEESTYQRGELDALLDMADIGFEALFEMQKPFFTVSNKQRRLEIMGFVARMQGLVASWEARH